MTQCASSRYRQLRSSLDCLLTFLNRLSALQQSLERYSSDHIVQFMVGNILTYFAIFATNKRQNNASFHQWHHRIRNVYVYLKPLADLAHRFFYDIKNKKTCRLFNSYSISIYSTVNNGVMSDRHFAQWLQDLII